MLCPILLATKTHITFVPRQRAAIFPLLSPLLPPHSFVPSTDDAHSHTAVRMDMCDMLHQHYAHEACGGLRRGCSVHRQRKEMDWDQGGGFSGMGTASYARTDRKSIPYWTLFAITCDFFFFFAIR